MEHPLANHVLSSIKASIKTDILRTVLSFLVAWSTYLGTRDETMSAYLLIVAFAVFNMAFTKHTSVMVGDVDLFSRLGQHLALIITGIVSIIVFGPRSALVVIAVIILIEALAYLNNYIIYRSMK